MSIAAEARVLFSLLRGLPRRGTHADRLDGFYGSQAAHYDRFRERLLKGRRELIARLPLRDGDRVVELGGGTGRNVDYLDERIARLESYEIVDLCRPLLDIAQQRVARHPQVRVVEEDATRYRPSRPVDCVVFSYALTMMPEWRAAIDNAIAMLRPYGTIAVVDFYVSAVEPPPGLVRHGALTRRLWPRWFAHDGVRLSPEPLARLMRLLHAVHLGEHLSPIPYLPFAQVPYFIFIGTKRT